MQQVTQSIGSVSHRTYISCADCAGPRHSPGTRHSGSVPSSHSRICRKDLSIQCYAVFGPRSVGDIPSGRYRQGMQLEPQFSIYSSVAQTIIQLAIMYNQITRGSYHLETELDYGPSNGAWRAAVPFADCISPSPHHQHIQTLTLSIRGAFTSATTQPGCSQRSSIDMEQQL